MRIGFFFFFFGGIDEKSFQNTAEVGRKRRSLDVTPQDIYITTQVLSLFAIIPRLQIITVEQYYYI